MIKIIKTFVAASIAVSGGALFSACSEEPSGSSFDFSAANEYKNLPKCSLWNDAEKVTVEGSDVIYVCRDEIWEVLDTTFVANDTAKTLSKIPNCADAQEGNSFYIEKTGVNYICKDERWEIAIIPTVHSSSSQKQNVAGSSNAESADDANSSSSVVAVSSSNEDSAISSDSATSGSDVSAAESSSSSEGASSSSAAIANSSSSSESDEKVVATKDDLPNCTMENEGDTVYVKKEDKTYQCSTKRTWGVVKTCGNKNYNDEDQICESGIIYNKSDYCYFITTKTWNTKYPVADYYCTGTDVKSKSEYGECGDGYYTKKKEFCSDGVVYPLCGEDGEYDNPAKAICFDDKVYYEPTWSGCYDGYDILVDVYEVATQFCGKKGIAYGVYEQADYCKTELAGTWDVNYPVESYYCNNGSPLDKSEYGKCGSGFYNKSTELCFEDETYSSSEKKVCGENLYDVKDWGVCVKATDAYVYMSMPEYLYNVTEYVDVSSYAEDASSGQTQYVWKGSANYGTDVLAVAALNKLGVKLMVGWNDGANKYTLKSNIKTSAQMRRLYEMVLDGVTYRVVATVYLSNGLLRISAIKL